MSKKLVVRKAHKTDDAAQLARFRELESPVNDLCSMAQLMCDAYLHDPKSSSVSFSVFHLEDMINDFKATYYGCFGN